MPVDENGNVHFKTTLFALIRESLSIRMGPGNTSIHRVSEKTSKIVFVINSSNFHQF